MLLAYPFPLSVGYRYAGLALRLALVEKRMVRVAEGFYAVAVLTTLAGLALSPNPGLSWVLLAVAGSSLMVGVVIHSISWSGALGKRGSRQGGQRL